MTKKLVILQIPASGIVDVQCPVGRKIRIATVIANLSAVATGDNVRLTASQGSNTLWVVNSPGFDVTTASAGFGIGQSTVQPLTLQIDPVTGIATFNQQAHVTAGLPDVWFPFQLRMTLAAFGTGAVAASVLVYEEQDLGSS